MEERFESKVVPGRYFVIRHDGTVPSPPAHRASSSGSSAAGALVAVGLICLVAAALSD